MHSLKTYKFHITSDVPSLTPRNLGYDEALHTEAEGFTILQPCFWSQNYLLDAVQQARAQIL